MSKGGRRAGAGRRKTLTSRDQQTRVMMTQAEHDDLTLLAEQWCVPVATAAYGIFADSLAKMRRVRPQSPENLVLAASRAIARHEPAMQATKMPPERPAPDLPPERPDPAIDDETIAAQIRATEA